jgi:hypothetical protein
MLDLARTGAPATTARQVMKVMKRRKEWPDESELQLASPLRAAMFFEPQYLGQIPRHRKATRGENPPNETRHQAPKICCLHTAYQASWTDHWPRTKPKRQRGVLDVTIGSTKTRDVTCPTAGRPTPASDLAFSHPSRANHTVGDGTLGFCSGPYILEYIDQQPTPPAP